MKLFTSLFQRDEKGLVCPRCEKPLAGHDDGGCERRMSRRFFFGLCAGAAVVASGMELVTVVEAAPEALVVTAAPKVIVASDDWKDHIVVRSRGTSHRPRMNGSIRLPSGETEIRLPARLMSSHEWRSLTAGTLTPEQLANIK